ncbi:MAG: hypothetical protein Q9180_004850, partial [Flavoplaca navasiana]
AMITRSIRRLDVLKGDALTTPTVDNSLQQSRTTSQYFDLDTRDSQDDIAMSSPMEEKPIQELGIRAIVRQLPAMSHPQVLASPPPIPGPFTAIRSHSIVLGNSIISRVQGIVLTPTVIELQKGSSQGEAKAAPTDYVTELNEIEKIKAEPPSMKSIAAAPLYRHSDIDHQRATSDIDKLYIRNEAKAVHTTRESSSTMCTKLGSPTSSSTSATGKQLPKLG